MFRVDADDVELIGCTVIPNTFLVETLSKRIYIYNTTTISMRHCCAYGPAYGRYTANAQGRLSELEPDCSSLAALSCSERAVRYAE